MLSLLPQSFSIEPIIEQVNSLGCITRLELNSKTGEFFNDPWEIKPEFKNTPLGNVLDSLGDIGQARLLALDSSHSYTAHADPDDRIHLAIITNPYSFLVDLLNNKMHHIPVDGRLWYMDTGIIHVAANWGPRTRIHLNVRVLLPKYSDAKKSIKIKIVNGDYDWKQLAYIPLMSSVNKLIKNNYVTGFRGVSEREVWLNVSSQTVLDNTIADITNYGITVDVTR